ncbi:ThiF family adenylyltransferase [Salarchaeum sp. III]|uniref:ThiF family adenylyltransferase n=1 Tax=Salarchaeum sp. III TaxID=3107927 RepID=UPI002ED99CAD
MGLFNSDDPSEETAGLPNPTADVDTGREHHLAMTAPDAARLERILSPDSGPMADWGERGALCVITESTGANRTTLNVRKVVEPSPSDFNLKDKTLGVELEFEPEYRKRARKHAEALDVDAGLLYVHTHPKGASGRFSQGDREHDRAQLYEEVTQFGTDDVPLAAAVFHDGDDPPTVWRYDFQQALTPRQRESEEFGPESVERTAITAIRIVDARVEKRPTTDSQEVAGPIGAQGRLNEDQQDSTIKLWGKKGQRDLAGLRVGVIGSGGAGSILAEMLPRLGIGELVLVDFDRVKPANGNRHLGASPSDIENRRDKVAVSAEVAERAATCPDFTVRPVVGSIFETGADWSEYHALDEVIDCDIIVNAADPHTVRCTLGRLSYAHMIPVLDAGSLLKNEDGVLTGAARATATVSGPGHPCLACAGQWNDTGYTETRTGESLDAGYADDEDGDEDGEDTRQPSMMPVNMFTVGLLGQRFLELVHGLAPDLARGKATVRLGSLTVNWEPRDRTGTQLRTCRDSCYRPSPGDGDGADLKRGPDQELRDERQPPSE